MKLDFTVFDSVFNNEILPMAHTAMLGKNRSGKTENTKQAVEWFLHQGKKVLLFGFFKGNQTLINKWRGYRISSREDIHSAVFSAHQLVYLDTPNVDFEKLKEVLINNPSEWILVHDNLDELALNYEQNDFITLKLDFLHFVSEIGRVFNIYLFVTGKDMEAIARVLPAKKIVENAKNLLLLKQSVVSLSYLKERWLNEEQVDKLEQLLLYGVLFLRK